MNNKKDDIFALILESKKADQALATGALEKRDTFPSDWGQPNEGRLAVDVYDTGSQIIILAPMAGALPESVDVYLHDDMLSIRGSRIRPQEMEHITQSYHEECYWGPFSRSIVLPVDVVSGAAAAEFKHGLLTVRIPKAHHSKARTIPIEIVEE
jgi:HSP20 family protein